MKIGHVVKLTGLFRVMLAALALSGCTTVSAPGALPRQKLNAEECRLFTLYKGGSIYGDLGPDGRPKSSDLKAWLPAISDEEIQDLVSGPEPAIGIGRVHDCERSFSFAGTEGRPDRAPGGAGYSRPVFGRSGRVAVIQSWMSFGLLAGSGSICLLRRQEAGDWKVVECGTTWEA